MVVQQYLDFLGREPDEAGFNFWVNNVEKCGADADCRYVARINTSAAFFLSIEFQQTGFFVYRTHQAAYGNMPNAPVPIALSEFTPDTRKISNGVVVLQAGWETLLENNKQAYLSELVQRSAFAAAYPATLSPAEFVDRLFDNAGVQPSDNDRTAAIQEFGSAPTSPDAVARIRALRDVADNEILTRQEFSKAFVLIQYFGYLHRDPNSSPDLNFDGYNVWLNKLNELAGTIKALRWSEPFSWRPNIGNASCDDCPQHTQVRQWYHRLQKSD